MKVIKIKNCKQCPHYVLNIFDEQFCTKYKFVIRIIRGISAECKLPEYKEYRND